VVPAVRGVDLECKPGQILGIVGPNGAGKTSLLSGIAGVKKTSGGSVLLDGQDMSRWPAYRRGQAGVVMVNERRRVFPSLSVRENLAAGGWGLGKDEVEARTEQMLDLFPRLRERETVPSFRLSGGEQRMVSIARALMTGARCLLLDELSLGLAPRIVAQLTEVVRQLADEGRIVLLLGGTVGGFGLVSPAHADDPETVSIDSGSGSAAGDNCVNSFVSRGRAVVAGPVYEIPYRSVGGGPYVENEVNSRPSTFSFASDAYEGLIGPSTAISTTGFDGKLLKGVDEVVGYDLHIGPVLVKQMHSVMNYETDGTQDGTKATWKLEFSGVNGDKNTVYTITPDGFAPQ